MNMMNKCAKFHKNSLSGKKVKFNLSNGVELSGAANFVYNFVQIPNANEQLRWRIWPTFLLDFYEIFTEDASQRLPLPWCKKKSKWPKLKSRGGGPASNIDNNSNSA